MRCALLGPTPGRQRSASISSARRLEDASDTCNQAQSYARVQGRVARAQWLSRSAVAKHPRYSSLVAASSKRQLESRRQVHPGTDAAELLLARLGYLVDGVVDRGGDHVFRHFRIIRPQLPVDP